ncbi:hypothetical protein OH779_29455 [Actinacidiphila glaucinigra]|uniref:ABC transporter permease n=1 Tax=Actinacidiphila glaucinigra TaxID=235986 RepID=UPI00386F7689
MPPSRMRRLLRDETGVAAVLVLLVLVVGIAEPDFLTRSNLTGTAHNACYVGLMAAGMVFALAMREVDLPGGVYALGVTVGAVCICDGWSPWAAAAPVLVLSALLGAGNAIVATYVGLPTFIVTLATAMLFRGIGLALADGRQISGMPQDHAFFRVVGGDAGGLPTAVWVLLATTAALTVLLTRPFRDAGPGGRLQPGRGAVHRASRRADADQGHGAVRVDGRTGRRPDPGLLHLR